jgi:hypothetical protein
LGTKIEIGQGPGGIRADAVGGGAIDAGRRFGSEFVGVLAVANLREDPAGVRAGLRGRNFGDGAGLHASGVGGVLGLTGWNGGGDEADGHRSWCGDSETVERKTLRVGYLELRQDGTIAGDAGRLNLEHQARAHEVDHCVSRVKCLLARRKHPGLRTGETYR